MRWWPRWRVRVNVAAPPCRRCGGTGLDPALEDVVCWSCNGSGDLFGGEVVRVRLTRDVLLRWALGEFRRGPA